MPHAHMCSSCISMPHMGGCARHPRLPTKNYAYAEAARYIKCPYIAPRSTCYQRLVTPSAISMQISINHHLLTCAQLSTHPHPRRAPSHHPVQDHHTAKYANAPDPAQSQSCSLLHIFCATSTYADDKSRSAPSLFRAFVARRKQNGQSPYKPDRGSKILLLSLVL